MSPIWLAMFDFLKKKPVPAPSATPPPASATPAPAEAPVRTGFSPDDLARAFTDFQAEKAARIEAEKAQAREAVRETLGSSLLARSLGGLFSGNPRLDDDLLDEIETALISADVGVTATTELLGKLRKRMKVREFADAHALHQALR
ncbi:MAG: signal recognition particle receptor subunit alpha, partial [Gammaproteobacteria bacterium]|nr:signal recognition particle receptor subunit alpha [Gammaproteobacteria bacterium]